MTKSTSIHLAILATMVFALYNLPDLLGQETYRSIMVSVGCWQIGWWSADLAQFLARKFDANK